MPRGDEEVWRLPASVGGEDARLAPAKAASKRSALSPAAKERLARIVRRTPEVMVKITGRSRGIAGLKSHLDYITRNGRLEGETNDGLPVQDRADLRHLHDDWLLTNTVTARGRRDAQAAQSVGVILSMPRGTPKDRVHDAARTWARQTFGNRHDWLLVRHDDRDHPHVHLTVRAVGSDGRRLAPGPTDLQEWRERFAGELRRLGVAAEATPRQARGKVQRSERTAVHRIAQRGQEAKVRRLQRDDAAREALRGLAAPKPWESGIQARQEAIKRSYLTHAAELDAGNDADRVLARDIRRFVADLPVPLTRRQALATELKSSLSQHQVVDKSGAGSAASTLNPAQPLKPLSPEPPRRAR